MLDDSIPDAYCPAHRVDNRLNDPDGRTGNPRSVHVAALTSPLPSSGFGPVLTAWTYFQPARQSRLYTPVLAIYFIAACARFTWAVGLVDD